MKNLDKSGVSIIGGAGHVGFPLGLALAQKNFNVNLVDINKRNLENIKKGIVPFKEKGAKEALIKCKKKNKLSFSSNLKNISVKKYIIVCIGTPINKNLKPELKSFLKFINNLKKNISKKNIIIIRSSIYPGMINRIEQMLYNKNKPFIN